MTSLGIGRQRQADVNVGALSGARRSVPVDPEQLEEGARRRMSPQAFAYIGGADAFKAVALGASGVLIGRPYAYGLAIAGERGVRDVIKNFLADFDLTLGLAGCSSITESRPSRSQRAASRVSLP